MVRSSAAIALALVSLGLSREAACEGVGEGEGGVNAPCTRDKDCSSGLSCVEGVCVGKDRGLEPAVAADAGHDGG